MFQIKYYLQYKNTQDSKPRVLVKGINYEYSGGEKGEIQGLFEETEGGLLRVADLSDCRSLLTVEIDGVELRSLTVRHSKEYSEVYQFLYFDGKAWRVYEKYTNESLSDKFLSYCVEDNLYFFESDPAKYSKLLWDCSEQEGWQKVFKLLGIEL